MTNQHYFSHFIKICIPLAFATIISFVLLVEIFVFIFLTILNSAVNTGHWFSSSGGRTCKYNNDRISLGWMKDGFMKDDNDDI